MKVRPLFKQKEATKKWYTAFIEHYGNGACYKEYSAADTIQIDAVENCTRYQMLLAYVVQFADGGFWIIDGVMYVVTAGITSDKDASYDDAVKFIENWKSAWKEEK